MRVLAGIGGTRLRLAIYDERPRGDLEQLESRAFPAPRRQSAAFSNVTGRGCRRTRCGGTCREPTVLYDEPSLGHRCLGAHPRAQSEPRRTRQRLPCGSARRRALRAETRPSCSRAPRAERPVAILGAGTGLGEATSCPAARGCTSSRPRGDTRILQRGTTRKSDSSSGFAQSTVACPASVCSPERVSRIYTHTSHGRDAQLPSATRTESRVRPRSGMLPWTARAPRALARPRCLRLSTLRRPETSPSGRSLDGVCSSQEASPRRFSPTFARQRFSLVFSTRAACGPSLIRPL